MESIENMEAWLWTITRNTCLKYLRKRLSERKYLSYIKEFFEDVDATTPFSQLVSQQKGDTIKKLINQLSPRQREVYLLHRHEGFTYQEIAEKLGIGHETVKEHAAKALKHMREWLVMYTDLLILLLMLLP